MQKFFRTCIVFLTLLVFLVTASGNVFGYAWCFGDGHSRIEPITPVGCADKDAECIDVSSVPTDLTKNTHGHGSPCSDVLLSQGHALFGKRSAQVAKFALDAKKTPVLASPDSRQSYKSVSYVSPARESQTIIAHRTVVLLN